MLACPRGIARFASASCIARGTSPHRQPIPKTTAGRNLPAGPIYSGVVPNSRHPLGWSMQVRPVALTISCCGVALISRQRALIRELRCESSQGSQFFFWVASFNSEAAGS
jgi:hypothetical protein